jgi:hypothetical protein
MTILEQLFNVENIYQDFGTFIIRQLLPAIIILLVGWLVGKVFGKLIKSFLKKAKADKYFKFGRGFEVSNVFSVIATWTIYLVAIIVAVDTLQIGILSDILLAVLMFIPDVVIAIIIILVGYILAKYVHGQIIASKVTYSEIMGQVVFFFIIIIAIDLALHKIGLEPFVIDGIILILVGSVGLGLAIALGLGLKETVAKMAKKYAKRK